MRQIPNAYHNGGNDGKKSCLLEVKQGIKVEYLACSLAENHTQHKTIDMEMVDSINLRVKIVEHTEQHHAHYLHNPCCLGKTA